MEEDKKMKKEYITAVCWFFGMSKQDAKKYIKTATPEILNAIYDGWGKQVIKNFYVD